MKFISIRRGVLKKYKRKILLSMFVQIKWYFLGNATIRILLGETNFTLPRTGVRVNNIINIQEHHKHISFQL